MHCRSEADGGTSKRLPLSPLKNVPQTEYPSKKQRVSDFKKPSKSAANDENVPDPLEEGNLIAGIASLHPEAAVAHLFPDLS